VKSKDIYFKAWLDECMYWWCLVWDTGMVIVGDEQLAKCHLSWAQRVKVHDAYGFWGHWD